MCDSIIDESIPVDDAVVTVRDGMVRLDLGIMTSEVDQMSIAHLSMLPGRALAIACLLNDAHLKAFRQEPES
ncbi:hypothetical protein [Paeniglutamicibacter terrestris]|uniref:Uncharacterized protein n=1 Tax=Paeniglutamicibacter terrestris TaxID=2723403 RepID=A0ABX1G490_9MICC|nr:hypothetical protein [Paeniglutamicibacter terrestris]NKG21055.1 hypothetical protein [Paeniglutamicibacter terrestris]